MGEMSEAPSMETRIRLNLPCKDDDEDMVSHLTCFGYPKGLRGGIVYSEEQYRKYDETIKKLTLEGKIKYCPYYVPDGENGRPEFCAICSPITKEKLKKWRAEAGIG